jgi:hypothetical protein
VPVDDHRVPAQRRGEGTAYVCVAAEDEETAYRIVDLISEHHPATEPRLRRTRDGLVAFTLTAVALPPPDL